MQWKKLEKRSECFQKSTKRPLSIQGFCTNFYFLLKGSADDYRQRNNVNMLEEASCDPHNDSNDSEAKCRPTTHYHKDGIKSGERSIALLDMLAEVASHTLHTDPSVKKSPKLRQEVTIRVHESTENVKPSKNITQKQKSICSAIERPVPGICKLSVKKKKIVGVGDSDYCTNNLSNMSVSSLIKRLSEFDGNELRRTFTYTCKFDIMHCQQRFSSFGSEIKARKQITNHLLRHIQEMEHQNNIGGVEHSSQIFSKQVALKKVTNVTKKKQLTNSYKPKSSIKININSSTSSHPRIQKRTVLQNNVPDSHIEVITAGSETHEQVSQDNIEDINLETKQPLLLDLNCVVNEKILSPEIIIINMKDETCIYNEHNYMKQNTDDILTMKHKLGSYHVVDFQRESLNQTGEAIDGTAVIIGNQQETYHLEKKSLWKGLLPNVTTARESHGDSSCLQLMPFVGREIDVQTSQLPAHSTDGFTASHGEREEPDKIHWKNAVDVNTREFIRDCVPATVNNSNSKKVKGTSKLLGQSQAEKDLAIRLIESIKYKGSHPDSLECNICSPTRFFTALTTLISHYRSHAGIKPYECRLCGHVFTRQHSLNYHLLIHGNVTRFECTDCGRKFRHPSHFKEHRRRHTGEAPYECHDCPLRFKTRNTYKRHLKTRHGKVLTTSGGLISLSDEEFGQVRTASRARNLSPALRRKHLQRENNSKEHSNHDIQVLTFMRESEEKVNDCDFKDENETDSQSSSGEVDVQSPTPSKGVDKENAMTDLKTKTNSKLQSLPTDLNFHDIVEEAMRQSDILLQSETDDSVLNVSTIEFGDEKSCDSRSALDVARDEVAQQNGTTNYIDTIKTEQKLSLDCNTDEITKNNKFEALLKTVPLFLSKVEKKTVILPNCPLVPNAILNQNVTVNLAPFLTGNANVFNAGLHKRSVSNGKPSELRVIHPKAKPGTIMLIKGTPRGKSNT